MNTTTQPHPGLSHDEIARLARRIWQQEGCQSGRDEEYWLQAEQQLRAISQQGNGQTHQASAKRKPAAANPRKRISAKI
jgi:hypothetical protein